MLPDPVFLYVEDEPLSRLVMDTLLIRAMGYKHLSIFEDSTGFMDRIKELPTTPDVIFLDIHMQPYNGFEMLSMLRQHPVYSNAQVIALTASVMNEEVRRLREAGVVAAAAWAC